jgi:hypothetical protein
MERKPWHKAPNKSTVSMDFKPSSWTCSGLGTQEKPHLLEKRNGLQLVLILRHKSPVRTL